MYTFMIQVAKISPLGVTFHPARHAYVQLTSREYLLKKLWGQRNSGCVTVCAVFFSPYSEQLIVKMFVVLLPCRWAGPAWCVSVSLGERWRLPWWRGVPQVAMVTTA